MTKQEKQEFKDLITNLFTVSKAVTTALSNKQDVLHKHVDFLNERVTQLENRRLL